MEAEAVIVSARTQYVGWSLLSNDGPNGERLEGGHGKEFLKETYNYKQKIGNCELEVSGEGGQGERRYPGCRVVSYCVVLCE